MTTRTGTDVHEDENDHDRELVSPGERFGQRIRTNVSAEALQARVIEAETRSLARTFDELSRTGDVPRAAALILGARRRYIGGLGKAAAYAELLGADLSATLSNVFLVDGRALTPLTVLTDVRASDVLVVFSMRRYREETVRFGELFREAGGELLVITDSEDAPLAGVASSLIRVHTGSASYADSPTSVAAVCHLLSTLTTASAKGARRRLAVRDRFGSDLGLYRPSAAGEALNEPEIE
ncbi:MurR/RpiR family transcriptional regulator [Microbacterium esteraromaticum]|uniref:MurR/RpiR family transcriptional regulator n=1 Tax=Microbacterium esteraromaticum TaxID=57043 RepID=UPI00195DD391|nr:SIS domain-containing protein [Microbacterium esteraromaticum]MBM7466516.1 DNA-binding MurR/RpiR family transcriptional regulator [Microbacterium esteraromaticum]